MRIYFPERSENLKNGNKTNQIQKVKITDIFNLIRN